MTNLRRIGIILCCSSLSLFGQTVADSSIVISKELEEIEVIRQRTASFVDQQPEKLVVDMRQVQYMPKFLGTSDPVRYLQSLPGIQTNNETSAGIHIQGCDDYQTLISINGAPVLYPNHMLGLFSTFIGPHFHTIGVEQAQHKGTMENRIGGWIDFSTHTEQPERFGFEGNIGLVNSDITFSIPMGKRHALWISARSSYVNELYGRFMKSDDYVIRYHFMDFNLSYTGRLSETDRLVITGFYSRDNMRVYTDNKKTNIGLPWQNIVGSAYWEHYLEHGTWRTTAYCSSFDNKLQAAIDSARVKTDEQLLITGLKNRLDYRITNAFLLSASLDYGHYISRPLAFTLSGISLFNTETETTKAEHADELSLSADLRHDVCKWFAYNIGLHGTAYAHQQHWWWSLDPRVSAHFMPAKDHTITVHYGMYHQYFHKAGLTGGGLPTDFFFLASRQFAPEIAHACNLRYVGSFYRQQFSLSAELYYKQIYNITESTGNVLEVLNKRFSYEDYIVTGKGRNYGLNLMFQRNYGIVTGYVSYTLGWARRSLPGLEGYDDYRYAASSERVHDLKIVLNSRFAKRWNISGMFVLATGIPYTKAEEMYVINGKMVCRYSTFNGAHMPLYHRLDLSCSCDIIKTKEHELGINLSVYNVYAHKNAQFVVYRQNLTPINGSGLITIIPSISIYGKF